MGSAIRDAGGRLADIVADLTGLTVDEVKAERAEGRSMEEIAESNGVDGQAVIDAAVEARTTILDAKVAEGTITREQADAAFERMTDRIGERVTSVEVGRPEWAGQGRGRGQMGSGTCDGSCTAAQ
jgi:hypothetical protein